MRHPRWAAWPHPYDRVSPPLPVADHRGPDWVKAGDDRFDIDAKVEDPSTATEERLYQMLQELLTERSA